MKPFQLGLIVGRFQHLHIGHERMIEVGMKSCENLLVLVGSSQESMTLRNPFNLKTRMDVIKDVYGDKILLAHIDDLTHENDHSTEWGKYVLNKVEMWKKYYGIQSQLDAMIFGNDEERMTWYEYEDVSKVSQIVLSRNNIKISATEMRGYLANNDRQSWNTFANPKMHDRFNYLKDELMQIPTYREKVNNG